MCSGCLIFNPEQCRVQQNGVLCKGDRSSLFGCLEHFLTRIIPLVLLFAAILFGYSAIADNEFALWKVEFREAALREGINAETLDIAFTGLEPDRKVLKLDAHQPEFVRPVWNYLENATTAERVSTGQQRLLEYGDLLDSISLRYGIDKHYLVAIWGLESNYGSFTGDYSVIRSLATLAFAGRQERRGFWTEQLMAALRILQRGDMSLVDMRGSWAGAIGHTQFIPTTFEAYAVDFDGDGRRDLKNSVADALASAANYLMQSGWQGRQLWGEEVTMPANFDWYLANTEFVKPAREWTLEHRIVPVSGDLLAGGENPEGAVYLPAGYRGPAFMVYPNFRVLLEYNNAHSYALAVGCLVDRLQDRAMVKSAWPRDDVALSHDDKSELQALLSAVGYSTEGVDGRIGPNTRSALRLWQSAVGFPADGYATVEHLKLLRGQVKLQE